METARPLRIPRRKIEPRSRRNRFAPLPPEGQSIAPVCVQASRESRFHDAIEIARAFVSPIFFTFFSPLLLSFTRSSPYPENIRCEASGTGRCEIAITRFDELGGNPPFDEFAPYLPTCLSASSFVHEVNYELFLLGTRYRELKFELRLEGNGGGRGESLDKNGINKEGNTADGVD